jgi:two-component system alkaline phosphatase synthesis response regulator PhoP
MSQAILVVDDDKSIVSVIRDYLQQSNYQVFVAYDGETALHILRRERPALMLLDLMLPGRDGWDVTRIVRQSKVLKDTPIIMLTARIDDSDKIVGLELGADDYVTKPFNPREVVARVRTVLRRMENSEWASDSIIRCGELTLNVNIRAAHVDNQPVSLTPTEFRLLHILMSNPEMVFTRTELVERAFGYDYSIDSRILDNHIRNLRKKIEPDPSNPIYIATVYGVGYRFMDPLS